MTFSPLALVLVGIGAVPVLAFGPGPLGYSVMLLCHGALVALCVMDRLSLPGANALRIERAVEPLLSLGAANPVRLTLRLSGSRGLRLDVRDCPPEGMPSEGEEYSLMVQPGMRHTHVYRVTPTRRGDFAFGDIWLRLHGRMGLVRLARRVPMSESVKVYPNLLETEKYNLMARRGRLQQVGIRAARLVGAGREFESLREYQRDDEYRRIDWKATARRGKLISRQYEVERSQNVVLMLDVGRTMLAEIDGIAKLDYAVNAALLLAYVASLADDRVGLLVFAERVQVFLRPRKGRAQVYAILDALYNAQAGRAEPDYREAIGMLRSGWSRRSLVVCFTDLWDPDSSSVTIQELVSLQPRHLVCAVTLMDTRIQRIALSETMNARDAYAQAAARQVLDDRARAIGALVQRGALVVDTPAEKLSAALVNRYLEVKERMRL